MFDQVRGRVRELANQLRPRWDDEEAPQPPYQWDEGDTQPIPVIQAPTNLGFSRPPFESDASMQVADYLIRKALEQLQDKPEHVTVVVLDFAYPGLEDGHLAYSLMRLSPGKGLEMVQTYIDELGRSCFVFAQPGQ